MQTIPSADSTVGQQQLLARIQKERSAGKKVLWLTSGGSNIAVTVVIMAGLTLQESEGVTIGLIDERYVPVGHLDSNWQQLVNAGIDTKSATVLQVLYEDLSLAATAERYDTCLEKAFSDADVILGLLGIGTDGHTAGILPGSSAADKTDQYVCGYQTKVYDRITITPHALVHFTAAYTLAFGEAKKSAIQELINKTVPIATQPAQILKNIKESYIFSDQIGGKT